MTERRHWTLVVVCLATGVLLLNVAAPNVALPDVGADLAAELQVLQWVVSGYSLALAATLLTAGTLADILGRRRMFPAGAGRPDQRGDPLPYRRGRLPTAPPPISVGRPGRRGLS